MIKRLIEAAEALQWGCSQDASMELQAALEAARQPVTVTPDQAVELIIAFNTAADCDDPTQAEIDGLTDQHKQEIVKVVTATLNKARELGL